MAKKIAFFVEGATERIFLKKLLLEVFNRKHISIEEKKLSGGSTCPLNISVIESITATDIEKYYVLIYDCGTDSRIKSDIIDHQPSLIASGYSRIIGLRDLYPLPPSDLARLKFNLSKNLDTSSIYINFVVAVMETEAWFLADTDHFVRIDPSLTNAEIFNAMGVDVSTLNVEQHPHPSQLLHSIYRMANLTYVSNSGRKSEARIRRTCNKLDYNELYLNYKTKSPSLNDLVNEIDACF